MLPGHPTDLWASGISADKRGITQGQTQLKEQREAGGWMLLLWASGTCFPLDRKCVSLNLF